MKTEQDKINAAHLKRTAQIKAAEKALKDNAKDLKAHITASGSNGVVLAIKVSAQKIHNARDTRSKALDQLSVMGLSATDVNLSLLGSCFDLHEIGRYGGWLDKRRRDRENERYLAENTEPNG